MELKILLPAQVLVSETVRKINAEAENGAFCLLPRHVDFVAALAPGIFSYETEDGREVLAALDEGVLVKQGREVLVSSGNGCIGKALGELRKTVEESFLVLDEKERNARSAVARIEAGFVRRFLEVQSYG